MKIVFLVSRFPYPLEKGDKLRAFQHMNILRESGHEIHLVALSDIPVKQEDLEKVNAKCASVHLLQLPKWMIAFNLLSGIFRKLPLQVAYFYSGKHLKRIHAILREIKPDLVYCQLIRTAGYVKELDTLIRVIDYQDAFSLGTKQRMMKAPWWLKPLFQREYRLALAFEANCYKWFDAQFVISEQDRNALNFPGSESITLLPNGVDTSWFTPRKSELNYDIAFVGNMNYPPNIDSAIFLVKEIMPLVWKEIPSAKVLIAGANPHQRVKALASEKVSVTGWIDDIRECYASSRLFVAPMRMGTGLQNKLLEAMAMGVASVTTPISAAPLGAASGTEIIIGSNAVELSGLITGLLRNETERNAVAKHGRDFVTQKFSIKHVSDVLNRELSNAMKKTDFPVQDS